METRKITVLMPVHNGANFVADALRSIEMQDCRDYSVFVSNNCSTDQTLEIVESFAQRIPIEIVTHDRKLSMIENFFFAFAQVKSPYCLFLCHDDCLNSPDSLSSALAIAEANPDITAVFCDLDYIDANGRRLLRRSFDRSGKFTGEELGKQSIRNARNMFGIPLLMKHSAIADIDGDERFSYVGDIQHYWRMSEKGPIYHIPRALFANRYHSSNSSWQLQKLAETQFLLLAEEHHVFLSPFDKFKLRLKIWSVGIQKRIFGLYAGYRSKSI